EESIGITVPKEVDAYRLGWVWLVDHLERGEVARSLKAIDERIPTALVEQVQALGRHVGALRGGICRVCVGQEVREQHNGVETDDNCASQEGQPVLAETPP